jgi:uncharacterized protein
MGVDQWTIRLLRPGDEGLLERFLLDRLETSLFLLGNMRQVGLVDGPERYQGSYMAAFRGAEMVGVAGHFWNQTVVLQAPQALPELLVAVVEASGRLVKRLTGPNEQVLAAMAVMGLGPADMQRSEPEKLYHLAFSDLRVPAPLAEGSWTGRRIIQADLELVAQWRVAYNLELMGETDTAEMRAFARRSAAETLAEGRGWVLEVDGRPVAYSGFNAVVTPIVQVGGVYTPPEWRSRGYGRAAVAASLLDMQAKGYDQSILFTGEDNWPAQRAYEGLGYRHIGDYHIALLREGWRPPGS